MLRIRTSMGQVNSEPKSINGVVRAGGGWPRIICEHSPCRNHDDHLHGADDHNGIMHDRKRVDAEFRLPGCANVDQSSTVQVQCTNTTPYNIGLNAGTGAGATVAVRKMTSGGATINYSLYTDNGRTTVWGNTVGTDTVSATSSGASQSYTVFGRVPAQTTPAPATYTDTITVTVTY
jgi:hypothetical protein